MVNTKFVFPYQLHQMLEDADTKGFDDVISWVGNTNNYFKIYNSVELEATILPNYFPGQTKYKSFLRQLNIYGFTRSSSSTSSSNTSSTDAVSVSIPRGSYSHPLLVRYQVDLCKNMKRRKIKGSNNHSKAAAVASIKNKINKKLLQEQQDQIVPSTTPCLFPFSLMGMQQHQLQQQQQRSKSVVSYTSGEEAGGSRVACDDYIEEDFDNDFAIIDRLFGTKAASHHQVQQKVVTMPPPPANIVPTFGEMDDYDLEPVPIMSSSCCGGGGDDSSRSTTAFTTTFTMNNRSSSLLDFNSCSSSNSNSFNVDPEMADVIIRILA